MRSVNANAASSAPAPTPTPIAAPARQDRGYKVYALITYMHSNTEMHLFTVIECAIRVAEMPHVQWLLHNSAA